MTLEFASWPSIPRLNRKMFVTEKIDGSNASVLVIPMGDEPSPQSLAVVNIDGVLHEVGAQSRKRLIVPSGDNYGFARWVSDHAQQLAQSLGAGRHFGEWWGSGIQRGYGLTKGEKRFSLFNARRYGDIDFNSFGLFNVSTVPVLAEDLLFDSQSLHDVMWDLKEYGSRAVPGYMRPEGLVVFHEAGQNLFKYLCEDDDIPKTVAQWKHQEHSNTYETEQEAFRATL